MVTLMDTLIPYRGLIKDRKPAVKSNICEQEKRDRIKRGINMHTFRMLQRYTVVLLAFMNEGKERHKYGGIDLQQWEKARNLLVECKSLAKEWADDYTQRYPLHHEEIRSIKDNSNTYYKNELKANYRRIFNILNLKDQPHENGTQK